MTQRFHFFLCPPRFHLYCSKLKALGNWDFVFAVLSCGHKAPEFGLNSGVTIRSVHLSSTSVTTGTISGLALRSQPADLELEAVLISANQSNQASTRKCQKLRFRSRCLGREETKVSTFKSHLRYSCG